MHVADARARSCSWLTLVGVRTTHVNNHARFLHSIVNRHLGKFQFGAIMNISTMNILVCVRLLVNKSTHFC